MKGARSTTTGTADATVSALALRPREAAQALSISERTLFNLVQRGELRPVRFGRVRMFPVDQLRSWLAEAASRPVGVKGGVKP